MSDEPRDEAAALARGVRRHLERERAAGNAELIARGASAKPRRAPAATPGAAPAPAAPPAPETDLFGGRSRRRRRDRRRGPPAAARSTSPSPISCARCRRSIRRRAPPSPPPRRPCSSRSPPRCAPAGPAACARRATRPCPAWARRSRASSSWARRRAPTRTAWASRSWGAAGSCSTRSSRRWTTRTSSPACRSTAQTVFIGNVLHCRPPENRVPLPHEIENSSPFLHRQLEALQPRIVCCLGKTAGEHLLRRQGDARQHARQGLPLPRRQADRDLPPRGGAAEPRAASARCGRTCSCWRAST